MNNKTRNLLKARLKFTEQRSRVRFFRKAGRRKTLSWYEDSTRRVYKRKQVAFCRGKRYKIYMQTLVQGETRGH